MNDAATLQALRIYLLAVIALVLCGLELELLMLNHLNTPLQLLPVGLVGGGIATGLWSLISPNGTSFRILMGLACTFRHPLLEEEFGRNYQSITRM